VLIKTIKIPTELQGKEAPVKHGWGGISLFFRVGCNADLNASCDISHEFLFETFTVVNLNVGASQPSNILRSFLKQAQYDALKFI
jgi:hypothetical protein